MMIIRHLQYLTALAKEQHFARAAVACNVTQPTLSAGIKQLEESLGVLLVERGQRYVGLTPEGERALVWAQRVLADHDGLKQELSAMREGLAGQLRIGAIPVTLPTIALLTTPFSRRHFRTRIVVSSQTSIDIQRGLDDFSLDIGLTYLDNEPLSRVRTLPLYRERYVLLTRTGSPMAGLQSVGWAEAATLPMCLLTTDMQNRRILDMHFHQAGAEAHTVVETNSLAALWSLISFGDLSTVVPQSFLLLLGKSSPVVAIPLVDPDVTHLIGLVASDRDPLPPVVHALLNVGQALELQDIVDRKLDPPYLPIRVE
jgi:DNA-binding transcriptional LysR family regulator